MVEYSECSECYVSRIRSRKVSSSEGFKLWHPPKKLNYANYIVNFELFCRYIFNLEVLSVEDLDFIKTKPNDIALSPFRSYSSNLPQYLSKGEFYTLKNLSLSKHIVIEKFAEGNSIVISDGDKYVKVMENFLCDQSKCQKTAVKMIIFRIL